MPTRTKKEKTQHKQKLTPKKSHHILASEHICHRYTPPPWDNNDSPDQFAGPIINLAGLKTNRARCEAMI